MKRLTALPLIIAVLVGCSAIAYAGADKESNLVSLRSASNITGEDYVTRFGAEDRKFYLHGLIDGAFLAPLFGGSEEKSELSHFRKWAAGMSSNQVSEIVLQYIKAHPEEWHQPLGILVWSAFLQAMKSK